MYVDPSALAIFEIFGNMSGGRGSFLLAKSEGKSGVRKTILNIVKLSCFLRKCATFDQNIVFSHKKAKCGKNAIFFPSCFFVKEIYLKSLASGTFSRVSRVTVNKHLFCF